MERNHNVDNTDHVVDIAMQNDVPLSAPSANVNSAGLRRGRFKSVIWIYVELVLTVSQIVSSIVVLALTRHEKPRAPLRVWIVGYICGGFAALPLLYWRYCHRNQALETDAGQGAVTAGARLSLLFARPLAGNNSGQAISTSDAGSGSCRYFGRFSERQISTIVDYLMMGLECFFAIWFVVGNVWIFGGRSSASESPILYWLCIVYLIFSYIGYAMPLILCATVCCCFPCIISFLSSRGDLSRTRGATSEAINALPTYKFKIKKIKSGINRDADNGAEQGGVVAADTDNERAISAEDAACCICLARYANNDVLRELPCSHFLHKECLDKWLKINGTCPMCKREIGGSTSSSGLPTRE